MTTALANTFARNRMTRTADAHSPPQRVAPERAPVPSRAQQFAQPQALDTLRRTERNHTALPAVQARPLRQAQQNRVEEALYDDRGQQNPLRPQRRDASDEHFAPTPPRRGVAASARMFNDAGEVNAWSRKEALQLGAHFIRNAGRAYQDAKRQRRLAAHEVEAQRQVIAQAMNDPEAFAMMGQELLLPIKEVIDYEGFTPRVLRNRYLSQGEYFRLAKDIRATAYVIGQDGQGIEHRQYGRYITPGEFKIGSFPTVDMQDVLQVNYDIMERAQDTARQGLELELDKRMIALIDRASRAVNQTVAAGSAMNIAAFETVRYQVERHRLLVDKFIINRLQLSSVINDLADEVDPVSQRELLLAGYFGSFLNAMIITSAGTGAEEVVPPGVFYAVTAPDYLGEVATRGEMFCEPFNLFQNFEFVKGWAVGMMTGFAIPGPKACARGLIS